MLKVSTRKTTRPYKRLPGKATIIEAIRASHGLISAAAAALGSPRSALSNRVLRDPELRAEVEQAREVHLDLAEAEITRAIRNQDTKTARWLLGCRGAARGYRGDSNADTPEPPPVTGGLSSDEG